MDSFVRFETYQWVTAIAVDENKTNRSDMVYARVRVGEAASSFFRRAGVVGLGTHCNRETSTVFGYSKEIVSWTGTRLERISIRLGRHCEERSDEAIQVIEGLWRLPLDCFARARNDAPHSN